METTIGLLGLVVTMVGVLVWVIKSQQATINNHLHELQSSVDRLPCRNQPDCPVEDKT